MNLDSLSMIFHESPWLACSIMFLIGTCIGSFLNVLALRSLKEESVIWPASYCPACKHSLSALDNIPVISYLMLGGKCRYCKEPISIQYPLVELSTGFCFAAISYVFLVKQINLANYTPLFALQTSMDALQSGSGQADLFAAIQDAQRQLQLPEEQRFAVIKSLDEFPVQKWGLFLASLSFCCTLIAVTVTDMREKLIPHEITYPSMLIGIAFSALIRGDLLGAMAGIGASYIIFDFLAFYGLKLYMRCRPDLFQEESEDRQTDDLDPELDRALALASEKQADEEPIEVMGGGDAVLSAVMSAYLGWQLLVLSLIIGFLAGTLMGLAFLFVEMKKEGILGQCRQKSLLFALLLGTAMGSLTTLMMSTVGAEPAELIRVFLQSFLLGAGGGAIIGMVTVGTRVSKPFPFGPALALGGFVAMFFIPYWLPFH